MTKPITNRREIVKTLEAQGWTNIGGGEHDNFEKPGHRLIQVPRHRELSLGVARSIAKQAGWK